MCYNFGLSFCESEWKRNRNRCLIDDCYFQKPDEDLSGSCSIRCGYRIENHRMYQNLLNKNNKHLFYAIIIIIRTSLHIFAIINILKHFYNIIP